MFHKSFIKSSVFNSEAATGGVLSEGCFGRFCRIHWGGGASGGVSIFDRVAGLKPVALLTGRLPVSFVGFQGAPSLQSASDDCFC